MAGSGPRVARTPLELLENDGSNEPSFLGKHSAPIVFGFVGFVSVMGGNWGTKRPVFSGIQRHILGAGGLAVLGKVIDNWRNDYLAERDAIFRDYVRLHPEDFPAYERKLFRDEFCRWVPIR